MTLRDKEDRCRRVYRGVKDVKRAIRKNVKGIVLIAKDVFPLEITAPFPHLCSKNKIPFMYVPSKQQLAQAVGTKFYASVCLIEAPTKKEDESGYHTIEKLANKMAAASDNFVLF